LYQSALLARGGWRRGRSARQGVLRGASQQQPGVKRAVASPSSWVRRRRFDGPRRLAPAAA